MFGAVFLLYLAFLRCGDSDAIVRRKIDDFDDSVRDLLHVKNVSSPGRKVEVRFEVYYAEQVLFEENNIRGDLRDPAMLNWTTVKRLKSWSPRRYCEFLHQLRNVTVFDLEGTIARECNFSLDWKVDVIWISPRYNQYYIVLGDFYDYRFIEKMFCRSPFTIQEEFYEKVVKRFHGEREHANSFASFKALCARINAEVHQLCYESQVMRGEQCIKGNFNNSGILIKREVRDLEDNVFCTFLQVLIAFYKSGHDEMLKMEHYRCRPIALLEFAAVPPENPKFVIVGNFNNFEFVRKVISQLTTDELKCTFFKKAIVSKHGDSEESTYADMYSTCVVKEMIRSKGSDRTEPSSIDETTTTQKVEDDYYWKMTGEKVALLCIIVLSIVVFNVLLSSIFWFIFMCGCKHKSPAPSMSSPKERMKAKNSSKINGPTIPPSTMNSSMRTSLTKSASLKIYEPSEESGESRYTRSLTTSQGSQSQQMQMQKSWPGRKSSRGSNESSPL